eukprot:CCRYP_007949-RA/>CCRYP_007949-RA protein AED:0.00 eAED:0.00 QI:44/1/1/1/0/0/2/41/39
MRLQRLAQCLSHLNWAVKRRRSYSFANCSGCEADRNFTR